MNLNRPGFRFLANPNSSILLQEPEPDAIDRVLNRPGN